MLSNVKWVLAGTLLLEGALSATEHKLVISKQPTLFQRAVAQQIKVIHTYHVKTALENFAFSVAVASSLWVLYLITTKGLQQIGLLSTPAHIGPLFFSKKSWMTFANRTKELSFIGASVTGLIALFYVYFFEPPKEDYLALVDQLRLCLLYAWPLWLVHDAALIFLHTTQTSSITLLSDLLRISKFYLPTLLKNKRIKALYRLLLKRCSLEQLKIDALKEFHGAHIPNEAPLSKIDRDLLMPPQPTTKIED